MAGSPAARSRSATRAGAAPRSTRRVAISFVTSAERAGRRPPPAGRRWPGRRTGTRRTRRGSLRSRAPARAADRRSAVAAGGRGELEPIETVSDQCQPPENLGHLGGQIDDRLPVDRTRRRSASSTTSNPGGSRRPAAGRRRRPAGADGSAAPRRQRGPGIRGPRGEDRRAAAPRPTAPRRRRGTRGRPRTSADGSSAGALRTPARARSGTRPGRSSSPGCRWPSRRTPRRYSCTGRAAIAGPQPDGQRPPPGRLGRLVEEFRLARPGSAHDLDRRSDPGADVADRPEHLCADPGARAAVPSFGALPGPDRQTGSSRPRRRRTGSRDRGSS